MKVKLITNDGVVDSTLLGENTHGVFVCSKHRVFKVDDTFRVLEEIDINSSVLDSLE